TLAVGCEGGLEEEDVERIRGLRRIELPASLTFGTAQRLHRMGITPAPVNDLQYLVYPWVVDCQTLRDAGWRPAYDNSAVLQALMEARAGHRAAGRRLPRKEVTITPAGAPVAGIGTAPGGRGGRAGGGGGARAPGGGGAAAPGPRPRRGGAPAPAGGEARDRRHRPRRGRGTDRSPLPQAGVPCRRAPAPVWPRVRVRWLA